MSDPQPAPPLPSELPVLPLRQTVVFPLTIAPLSVGRPLSIDSINRALSGNRMLLLLLQETEADDPQPDDLCRVGTVGVIRQMAKTPTGMNILVEGFPVKAAVGVLVLATSMPLATAFMGAAFNANLPRATAFLVAP